MNSKQSRIYHRFILMLLALYAFGLLVYSFLFNNFEGGRDNYAHYFISKYSWIYPHLLLDHWGKPLFTLLSSSFAQLGLRAVVGMNVLLAAICGFFVFKVANRLFPSGALSGLFLLLFSPYFFVISVSAMTEMMASALIAASLYFLAKERYTIASILFSSIVLIRTESFVLYPLFCLFLFRQKKYADIIYIFFFPALYSFIGFFYYKDLFWLITKNPYKGGIDVYGNGEFLHFVISLPTVIGWPFFIALVVSLPLWMIYGFRPENRIKVPLLLLTKGIWLTHLAAHSYAYWKGGHASMGLMRVLVPVIPAMALTVTAGMHFVISDFRNNRSLIAGKIAVMALIIMQIPQPWIQLPLPYRYDEQDKTMIEALDWYKQHHSTVHKLYYYDVFVPFYLNLNPFDTTKYTEKFDFKEKNFSEDNFILYDTRFGAIEGRKNSEDFLHHPRLKLLHYFAPIIPEKTFDGKPYEIFIFKTLKIPNTEDNLYILDSLKSTKYLNKTILFSDSFAATGHEEFFEIFNADVSQQILGKPYNVLHIKAQSAYLTQSEGIVFCISIEQDGKIKEFFSFPLRELLNTPHRDQLLNTFKGNSLKIFLWNQQKKKIRIEFDELEISLAQKVY